MHEQTQNELVDARQTQVKAVITPGRRKPKRHRTSARSLAGAAALAGLTGVVAAPAIGLANPAEGTVRDDGPVIAGIRSGRLDGDSAAMPNTGDQRLDGFIFGRSEMGLRSDPDFVKALATDAALGASFEYGYPVTKDEIPVLKRQLEIQSALAKVIPQLPDIVGEPYAGAEVHNKEGGRVEIQVTKEIDLTAIATLLPKGTEVTQTIVPHSLAELTDAKRKVMAFVAERGNRLGGMEVSGGAAPVASGSVVVWLAEDEPKSLDALRADLDGLEDLGQIPLEFRFGVGAATKNITRSDPPPYTEAGEFVHPGVHGAGMCTTAFDVRRNSDGLYGYLTAGHCSRTLNEPWYYPGPVGSGFTRGYMPCPSPGYINNSDSGFVWANGINDGKVYWDDKTIKDVGPFWWNNVAPGGQVNVSYGVTNGTFPITASSGERYDFWISECGGGQTDHNQSYRGNRGQGGDSGSPITGLESDGRLAPAGIYWGTNPFRDGVITDQFASSSMLGYARADMGVTILGHP